MTQTASPAAALPLSQRLRYGLETALFFLAIGFFRIFPVDTASAVGGWIGRNLIAPTNASKRARANLCAAFPDLPRAEIETIVKAMWDNLGRVMAEYGHLDSFRLTGANPRITVTGLDNLEAARATGKGIIVVSGHLANWEIMPFAARDYGLSGGTVVRPTNNPYVNAWLEQIRTRRGLPEMIAKGPSGTRRIFTLLRKGDCVLLLADQRTSEGIPAPFFGRDALTTPVPAALALKLGAVIVPASNERVNGAHFRMHVYPAIEPPNTGDADRDLVAFTAAINAFIEVRVRERPDQWLWIHRRWTDSSAALRKRAQALFDRGGAKSDTSSRV